MARVKIHNAHRNKGNGRENERDEQYYKTSKMEKQMVILENKVSSPPTERDANKT